MMTGEVAFPMSLSDAKPKTASTLRMFGFDDSFLRDAHEFVEKWTNDWLKKGSAHFKNLSEKIIDVSNNPVAIRTAILEAVPKVKQELEYSIARQRVMTPDTPETTPSTTPTPQLSVVPAAGVDKRLRAMNIVNVYVPPSGDTMRVTVEIGGKTVNVNVSANDVIDPEVVRKEYVEETGEEPSEGQTLITDGDVDLSYASIDKIVDSILKGLNLANTPDNVAFFNKTFRQKIIQAVVGSSPVSSTKISKPAAISGKVIRRKK
jgi:hypothetical protein